MNQTTQPRMTTHWWPANSSPVLLSRHMFLACLHPFNDGSSECTERGWIALIVSAWIGLLTWQFTYSQEKTTATGQQKRSTVHPLSALSYVSWFCELCFSNPFAHAASCKGRGCDSIKTNIYTDSLGLTFVQLWGTVLWSTHSHFNGKMWWTLLLH